MFLSADVLSLVLYCAQQLGVTLGVGAQTIMLVAYLSAMKDGILDSKEAQFVRATRLVLNTGLMLIIFSGVGITVLHVMAGQGATIVSEAYLFKWGLILAALVFTLLKNYPQHILLGLAGGSWYALFVVHILAPVASWINLLTLYVVWMVGFVLCWGILVIATRDKKEPKEKIMTPPIQKPAPSPAPPKITPPPAPKPAPPSAPVVKPAPAPPVKPAPAAPPNLPVLEQKHILQTLPQPEAIKPQPVAAVEKKEENPWLPAIQVMPKSPPSPPSK